MSVERDIRRLFRSVTGKRNSWSRVVAVLGRSLEMTSAGCEEGGGVGEAEQLVWLQGKGPGGKEVGESVRHRSLKEP